MDNDILYGYNQEYKIFKLNGQGKLILQFKNLELGKSISTKEKKWTKSILKKSMQFPKFKPFFKKILSNNKDFIYIQKMDSIVEEKEDFYSDFYSTKGYYICRVKMPISPLIIDNKEDNPCITKYLIENFHKFKSKVFTKM